MSVGQKFYAYFFLRLGLLVDGVNLTGLSPTKVDHRVHPLHLVFVPINFSLHLYEPGHLGVSSPFFEYFCVLHQILLQLFYLLLKT